MVAKTAMGLAISSFSPGALYQCLKNFRGEDLRFNKQSKSNLCFENYSCDVIAVPRQANIFVVGSFKSSPQLYVAEFHLL